MQIHELNTYQGTPGASDYLPIDNGTDTAKISAKDLVRGAGEQLLDFFHPVGSYYETSNNSFDPNTAWGGTWELLDEGYVLLSGSRSGTYRAGREYGENTHTLTEAEIPKHKHQSNAALINAAGAGTATPVPNGATYGFAYGAALDTSETGGGQPHNIMQKSKAVYVWHRTA